MGSDFKLRGLFLMAGLEVGMGIGAVLSEPWVISGPKDIEKIELATGPFRHLVTLPWIWSFTSVWG